MVAHPSERALATRANVAPIASELAMVSNPPNEPSIARSLAMADGPAIHQQPSLNSGRAPTTSHGQSRPSPNAGRVPIPPSEPPANPENPESARFNPYRHAETPPPPPKRGRGRPRKQALPPPPTIAGRPVFGPPRPPSNEDIARAEAFGCTVEEYLHAGAILMGEDSSDEEPNNQQHPQPRNPHYPKPTPPSHPKPGETHDSEKNKNKNKNIATGIPNKQCELMCPPTPSLPNTDDEYYGDLPSDIDMDQIEHLLNPTNPTHNPPASTTITNNSSLHFWQSIQKTSTPQGILISHQDQKKLTEILQTESLSIRQLAQQQEKFEKKIEAFMINLEKKINNVQMNNQMNPPVPTAQLPPMRQPNNPWINNNTKAKSKNTTTTHPHPTNSMNIPLPPPPSNQFLNQFKPSSFIIRKIPGTTPFEKKSPEDIAQVTNKVLKDLNAQTSDKSPIQVKAVSILKSGDIKFFVQTRAMTSWMLTNKHTWTHLCDPSLITRPTVFPVIIHSVPTSFSPGSTAHIQELCFTNNIDLSSISGIRWLGNPSIKNQAHGSLIISFLSKPLASQIEKGGLFFQSSFMRGAHYIKGPTQCFNCLEVGHTFKFCKNPSFCNNCGGQHNSKDCQEFETDSVKCHKCIKHYKNQHPDSSNNLDTDDLRFRHSATGALCPLRRNLQSQGAVYP